ncbi:MAG: glycoside hydrolase family 3 C-terminal domain-containing protein, partial [Clostridia bacterium]|nr:glycoside hydrolase family 3 C-terminal domain-containing protein [Clostridia bacterium]
MKLTTRFGEIFFACSASFLALMLALNVAGTQNASVINSAFGTETSKTVSSDGGDTDEDTDYYPQTYETADDLTAAYEALCRETEEEGIVLLKNDNNALPLSNGAKVSLFAQGSYNKN